MRVLPVISLISPFAASPPTQEVVRHRLPGSDLPVAMAVEVPAGVSMIHLSSVTPPMRPDGTTGDTRSQTAGVIRRIEATLRRLDLTLADVVRLRVFLCPDPAKGGEVDFAGFNAAYAEFFGTRQQPNLPVRSVVQVAGLADPSWLIEIEASAARQKR
jgi:enamine deaminase RidA (YjgF/YER057c/UK114 family)